MNELNRKMIGLRAGDVLTNLNCGNCQQKQILVLENLGNGLFDFSVRDHDINIIRDQHGPWRWSISDMVFRNKEGDVHQHIGHDIKVREAVALREVGWYKKLPQLTDARFAIDPDNVVGDLHEPALGAKLTALMNRSDSASDFYQNLQLAIDLILGDSAELVDERRMRLIMSVVHDVGLHLANKRQSLQRDPFAGLGEIIGAFMGGEGRSGHGPSLIDLFAQMERGSRSGSEEFGGRRRERRDPHRGNGHDHSAERGHAGFPG